MFSFSQAATSSVNLFSKSPNNGFEGVYRLIKQFLTWKFNYLRGGFVGFTVGPTKKKKSHVRNVLEKDII